MLAPHTSQLLCFSIFVLHQRWFFKKCIKHHVNDSADRSKSNLLMKERTYCRRYRWIYLSQISISSGCIAKSCAVFRSVGIITVVPQGHKTILSLRYWYFHWVSKKPNYNKSLWEAPISTSLLESPTRVDLGVITSEVDLKREIVEAQIEDDTWRLFFFFLNFHLQLHSPWGHLLQIL